MRVLRVICLSFLVFYSASSWTATDIYSLSLEDLLKIKTRVTSNVEESWRKQPVSVSVITHDKKALSSARSLSGLLNLHIPEYFLVEDQDDKIAGKSFSSFQPSRLVVSINAKSVNLNKLD